MGSDLKVKAVWKQVTATEKSGSGDRERERLEEARKSRPMKRNGYDALKTNFATFATGPSRARGILLMRLSHPLLPTSSIRSSTAREGLPPSPTPEQPGSSQRAASRTEACSSRSCSPGF